MIDTKVFSPRRDVRMDALAHKLWERDFPTNHVQSTLPKANVLEDEKSFVLKLLVPGFSRDQIELEIKEHALILSGRIGDEQKAQEGASYRQREFALTDFTRVFRIDDSIDQSAVEASMTDGVLSVVLPKKEEVYLSRKIEVK